MTTTATDTASRAADVVAIYRSESMEQVLGQLRPLSASTYETAELMEHPVEDGSLIADHLVLNPTELEFTTRASTEDIPALIDEARQLQIDAELLTVQTRSGSIFNMVLTGFPRNEDPDAPLAPLVVLRFRQARFITPEYGDIQQRQAARPRQASTTARGQQQARPATSRATGSETQERGSLLYRTFGGGRR